jgi:hypothetical protein
MQPRPLAPTRKELALIGGSAFLLRLATFLALTAGMGFSLKQYAAAGDGTSYQHYAQAILGNRSQWTPYDQRVFPGYPLLIAAWRLATRMSVTASALAVVWISAALAAVGSAVLFQDRRIGWAMVMLIPHWPINSSLIMSEAAMLALTTAGLIAGLADMAIPAGLILGMAMLVRPVAVFALAGLLFARWRSGGQRLRALLTAAAALLVVAAGMGLVQHLTGSPWRGIRVYADSPSAYGGHIFAWPFQTLMQTSWCAHPPPARLIYVWAHVLAVLGGCALLVLAVRRRKNVLDGIALCWLGGNTLFTLCIGSGRFGWGFYHFPRFTIPAMPALFWALSPVLPSRRWIWICLAIILYATTVAGVHQALTAGPMPRLFTAAGR